MSELRYDTPEKREVLALESAFLVGQPAVANSAFCLALRIHAAPLELRIRELEEANRWIPVGEREPRIGATVLVFCKSPSGEHCSVHTWTGSGLYTFITHWKPLPTPPIE